MESFENGTDQILSMIVDRNASAGSLCRQGSGDGAERHDEDGESDQNDSDVERNVFDQVVGGLDVRRRHVPRFVR